MFSNFFIYKKSGTYAETLEAFGLAILLNELLNRLEIKRRKITIEDKGLYYLVSSNKEITNSMVDTIEFFQINKFLIKNRESKIPNGIAKNSCFDYPAQKAEQDKFKVEFDKITKSKTLSSDEKNKLKRKLNQKKIDEFGLSIDVEFDVYREFTKNPYSSYTKLYENFYKNKANFHLLIKEILCFYSNNKFEERDFNLVDEKPTAQQLLNPSQGKGLNKNKANNLKVENLKSSWISETMKFSGALKMMTTQYVKVGSSYDLKLYVPDFVQIQLNEAIKLITEFKRYLKSTSPIKLDILNIIDLTTRFIQHTPEYNRGKVKNTVKGFHSVYQKDLGKNKAVANIAFINTPDFVEYFNVEQGREWIDILTSQRDIIRGIEESGDSIQGLLHYRNFLNSNGERAFIYFNAFITWYSMYLTQSLSKKKYFVKPFNVETLNKFYSNMDKKELNLKEIIENEGFQAVAKAIRKSTVSLQYTPKENRIFEIRYGVAQQLQNKSKTKEDFITFIGEFIGVYNAETARFVEKKEGKIFRANVKDEELDAFYSILDYTSPKVVSALLISYGFALEKHNETEEDKIAKISDEAQKLGYNLVKIDHEIQNEETEKENI